MTDRIHPAFREIANFLDRLKDSFETAPLTVHQIRDVMDVLDKGYIDDLTAKIRGGIYYQAGRRLGKSASYSGREATHVYLDEFAFTPAPQKKGWYRDFEKRNRRHW